MGKGNIKNFCTVLSLDCCRPKISKNTNKPNTHIGVCFNISIINI